MIKAAIMVRPVRVLHNHTGQDSYVSYLVRTKIEIKLRWAHQLVGVWMHLSLWMKRTGLLYYQLRCELNCLIHSRHIQRPKWRGLMSWWNTVRRPFLNVEVIFTDKSRSPDRGVHLFSMAASLWNEPNNHILRPLCLEWYCSLPCNITTQRHETSNSSVSDVGVESTPAVCWVYSSSQRSSWKWGVAAGSFWSDDQCCGDTCCYRGKLCPLKKQ
jgi:hypothetical protein